MRKTSLLFLVAAFAVFTGTTVVQAASLYMDPAFSSIGRGDAIAVSVRLDTDEENDECINAVNAVIKYSENVIPADVSIGDSILSMWLERPKIDTVNRTITFAGGIPNGYCGRVVGDPRLTNSLAQLIFRSPGFSIGANSEGTTTAKIEFTPETTAYLNDGLGTKADLALFGASIDLSKNPGAQLNDPWRDAVVTDDVAPEPFSITLHKDDFAFNGRYFVAFNTSDKQTGIDQYQVMEEPLSDIWTFDWGRADAPWIVTPSPYELKDQSLNSIIRVKAIDKAGNEHIATLIPDEAVRTLPTRMIILYAAIGLIGLIAFVMLVVAVRALLRRRRERVVTTEAETAINKETK